MRITGDVLGWIKSFLPNRKQKVAVEGEMSPWTDVKCGIPQGSVLGPILFVVFINDMPNSVLSTCNMFADDAKVYINKPDDHEALQSDLDRMNEWSQVWLQNANVCRNHRFTYSMNNHLLESINEEKDFGVIVDDSLKFHRHTAAAVKKFNKFCVRCY